MKILKNIIFLSAILTGLAAMSLKTRFNNIQARPKTQPYLLLLKHVYFNDLMRDLAKASSITIKTQIQRQDARKLVKDIRKLTGMDG